MKKKERPGFMVFHDDMVFVERMRDEDVGRLFKAMRRYSAEGEEPQFDSDVLQICWEICRTMLDRDQRRYREVCDNNSYSAYCKNADARGEVRMSKEAYLEKRERERSQGVRAHTNGRACVRNVPTTTATTMTIPTTIPTAMTAQERDLSGFRPYDSTTFEQKRNERLNMIPVC